MAKTFKELPCLDGSTFRVSASNSFAAPVVTAEIYKILSKRPGCLISEMQNILAEKAGKLPPGRHGFNSFLWSRERVSSVPIILVTPESAGPVLETVDLLRKDGYAVEAFGLKGTVPLSLYTDEGFVSDDLLNGLACIYKADIFFVAADKANTSPSVGDAWIEKDSLTAGGFRKRYGSGKELKTRLVEIFTDIAE